MTRRDRLEAKMTRRLEWAGKADARSEAAAQKASSIADRIPFGQPILVGHHSERRHRRDAERIRSGFQRAHEEAQKAEHHRQRADGLERALNRSVFSDDLDAVAALEARIAERTAALERMKAINKAFRAAEGENAAAKLTALVRAGQATEDEAGEAVKLFSLCPWEKAPFPTYAISNLRADITRNVKRLEEIKTRQQRAEAAESSPDGVTVEDFGNGYVRVTFAEKPERYVLDALRAAGYRWRQGSWTGPSASLPAEFRPVSAFPSGPTQPQAVAAVEGETMRACTCSTPQPRFSPAELAGVLPGQGRAPPAQVCDGCFRILPLESTT